ncbi:4-chlorobenzoyl coenzyme A dehalogenase [Raoultella terrigena]|uniref:4-chlorobenzoyl coenzyme A dehalogenase n=1 Tax=Raoultella terrigena TaxID=577 RepID=A0A3P8JWK9_RAOTE|nr:4-chlorobenzoyl coenzyme A dehalogenase [Raoultella terrigena]
MHQQLAECLTQAERDDSVRCLLITGAGRGFCAGQDLNDRNVDPSGPAPDLGLSVERFYNPLVRRLAALPKPVIAAVNGVAAGAGATLALGCDMVLAARSASFVMAFRQARGWCPTAAAVGSCRGSPTRQGDGAGAAGREAQRRAGRAVGDDLATGGGRRAGGHQPSAGPPSGGRSRPLASA